MDGAADLFIEEHVLAEALDAVIRADAPLAQDAGARVRVEQGGQQLLAFRSFFLDNPAVLEPQLNIRHFLPVIQGRVFESDPAVDRILEGTGEDLTIREVIPSIRNL